MKMEPEKVDYILNHYSHFMTLREAAAWKHWATNYKMDHGTKKSEKEREAKRNHFYEKGWLTRDKEVLELLEDGIEAFRRNTAKRIDAEKEVYYNNCSKCGKLARTPMARQCRFCGHTWFN